MAAQPLDDSIVTLVRVLGIGRDALHLGHSQGRAQLAVVVLVLFFLSASYASDSLSVRRLRRSRHVHRRFGICLHRLLGARRRTRRTIRSSMKLNPCILLAAVSANLIIQFRHHFIFFLA